MKKITIHHFKYQDKHPLKLIILIRKSIDITLKEAKKMVDRVMDGYSIEVEVQKEALDDFTQQLDAIEIFYEVQPDFFDD